MSTPKTMSSRLLTMKFMQRAAASSPTPNGSATPSESSQLEPTSKKQRLSNGSAVNRRSNSNLEAVQVALAEEELRKSQAHERRAAEVGEERWVLDVPKSAPAPGNGPVQVVMVSMADIDALSDGDEDSDGDALDGRRKYGPNVKHAKPDSKDSSDDSDESDESEYDPMGLNDLIKEGKKAAGASTDDTITFKSISNAGSGDIKCHRCGERGHIMRNCPMITRDQRIAQDKRKRSSTG